MRQVNSIHTLEKILRKAVAEGAPSNQLGEAITRAMGLSHKPSNMTLFCEILSRTEKDIRRLENVDYLEEDIEAIIALQAFFFTKYTWTTPWTPFAEYINTRGIIRSLKSWAKDFSEQMSEVFIEEGFLNELQSSLEEQLDGVSSSCLTERTKDLLTRKIKEILVAIEDCRLYGTQYLKVTTHSILWEGQNAVEDVPSKDKRHPAWKKFYATIVALDVALGMWANTESFLVPKLLSFNEQYGSIVQSLTHNTASDSNLHLPYSHDLIPKLFPHETLSLPPAPGRIEDEEE